MSKVRLWTLGSLEHRIAPTREGAEKLAHILSQIDSKSDDVTDIIWGPDLSVKVVEGESDEVVLMEEELAVEFLKSRGYNVLTPVQVRVIADSVAPLKGLSEPPSILLSTTPDWFGEENELVTQGDGRSPKKSRRTK